MKAVAIIPARGGSKRIPRKNIKYFLGKPVIAYSIEAALQSGLFDEVMVSTDDDEIAELARTYGANVPFMRSSKNADDFATTFDVIKEVLSWYEELKTAFDLACCIYPCAPFVSAAKLEEAKVKLENFDTVFPVVRFSYPIQRALEFNDKNQKLDFFDDQYATRRSQDLKPAFHDAGQFYWMKTARVLEEGKIITSNSTGIIVDEREVQDIDTPVDWQLAELKYKLLHHVSN
jgi:pseudaminic acid cytidylyltransferase